MRKGLYRHILDELRKQIAGGIYKPGDKLPTEIELARMYGVSRGTSALALSALAREGLALRTPRRGTIVSSTVRSDGAEQRAMIAWI